MLKQISCDKFMANNQVRPPIVFHKGLNAVIGDSDSHNSIGKSTLLMIIDFCFGGEDYIDKEKDVVNSIGEHTIKFIFEFDGIEYCFSRSTDENTFVYQYTDNTFTEVKKKLTLENFKKGLLIHYGLENTGLTFRAVVGRFFRIYNRNTHNELRPLNATVREDDKSGIESMLKLYGFYGNLDSEDASYQEALDKKKSYDNLKRFNLGYIADNKQIYEDNLKELETLEAELQRLQDDNNKGLSDAEVINAELKNTLKKQRRKLRSQRRLLENKLHDITIDTEYDETNTTREFNRLKEFFPDIQIDIEKLKKIEKFHRDVLSILNKELKEDKLETLEMIQIIDEQLELIDEQLKEFESTPDVSDAILTRFAELNKRIKELKEANKNFLDSQVANEEYKKAEQKHLSSISVVTARLVKTVNTKIATLNESLNNNTLPPELRVNGLRSYSYATTNDTGTGTRFKGVALFDLAVLLSTNLPAFVHDSIMFSNIEKPTCQKLLELYESQEKQIFIAFDHYDENGGIKPILLRNKVLELADEPYALFGIQWNKKVHITETEE